jgi:hydrogenase nickel incorporation protein HypA/HybF
MHEKALMEDLMRTIESRARAEGALRVTRIRVRLGALSHFTPQHFREHFVDASRGTLAEGAEVETRVRTDPTDADAQGVVLESIDVQL